MEKTILVVDDTPSNIDILVELLEGYELQIAMCGEDALGLLQDEDEELPDLVLLDIMMPGIDGYAVCEDLKKNDKTKDIPVVFLSAMTDEASKKRGVEVGGVDFVTKPFVMSELLASVEKFIK